MFKSIVEKINELEPELNLSVHAIRKLIPSFYTQKIDGFAGRKLFADQIRLLISFRNILSSAPRLSPIAVSKILQERIMNMERSFQGPENEYDMWLQTRQIDSNLHAYLVTETKLLIRQVLCLTGLLPNPRDIEMFYDESSVFLPYLQQLLTHCSNLERDFESLRTAYKALLPPVELSEARTSWYETSLHELGQTTEDLSSFLKKLAKDTTKVLANVPTVGSSISQVHYSNIPWLVLDILKSQGHAGTVTDGPRDGNRDLVTELNGERYLTQVKCHRFPPISEQIVRSFAETCRTYGCEHGMFVTTYRFSRSAASGQWAMRSAEGSSDEKIASIELIDMQRLVEMVIRHKVGIDSAGYLDSRYWTNMQIAGYRRSKGQV